jgi:hypothetical protein
LHLVYSASMDTRIKVEDCPTSSFLWDNASIR